MNGVIEAVHIFDEHNRAVLSHIYTSRPLSAAQVLPPYLEHAAPRPNVVYLANAQPPTLVFSIVHANLLYMATSSTEIEPLLVLEFLHRVVDALEEFLGAPVLAHKLEANYDVVAQLLTEMCDAGLVSTTEPNALRDAVEVEGLFGKLLGSISLPTAATASSTAAGRAPASFGNALANSPSPAASLSGSPSRLASQNAPAVPWRRANVRHTSNELYADMVETLSVTLAPSGRPLAAFAHGTIAFTSKVSGVPDISMRLVSSGGGSGDGKQSLLGRLVDLPVFHPCVRLSRWKDSPGELSFVPPDGRFILAGYEVDLLMPFTAGGGGGGSGTYANPNSDGNRGLRLPVTVEVRTGLGAAGAEFEVRINIHRTSFGGIGPAMGVGRGGGGGGKGGPHAGTAASPSLQDVIVSVPLPAEVRNLSDIRPSRGDASYNPADRALEWHVPNKEIAAGTSSFGLRCTVVGPLAAAAATGDDDDGGGGAGGDDPGGLGLAGGYAYAYEEPYQGASPPPRRDKAAGPSAPSWEGGEDGGRAARRAAQNRILMPSSASVSFSVKGWLPSGLRVESILIDTKRSRGLGEGVKPYKGVKYLTISKGGVEIRC